MTIAGVVLAAGLSRRMGGAAKPLLPLEGASFLERVVEALRGGGCSEVVVVTGEDERVRAEAERLGVRAVRNAGAGTEQIDSLRVGLRALAQEVEAAVVTPADFPRVRASAVGALIEAFRARGAPVVLPSHGGEHGHPTLFSRAVFEELLAGPLPEGARSVVHAHAGDLEEVPVPDDGVLHDVDTPEDYRRLTGDAP